MGGVRARTTGAGGVLARPKRASSPAKRDAVLKLDAAGFGTRHELNLGRHSVSPEETHLLKKVPPPNFEQRVPGRSSGVKLLASNALLSNDSVLGADAKRKTLSLSSKKQ